MKNITSLLKFVTGIAAVLTAVLVAPCANAWTRARLSDVDVTLQIAPSGPSEFVTEARFEVSAGQFHGFDLAPQVNSTLVPDKCFARIEGGLKTHVKMKKLFDGRIRIVLANGESVHSGAVVFTLVHETNLQAIGSLRKQDGKARLDWTPIIWDHGTDAMSVTVLLPDDSHVLHFDNEAMQDYEVLNRTADSVSFKKYRTVKWYSMQVVLDFDAKLVNLSLPAQAAESGDAQRPGNATDTPHVKANTASVVGSLQVEAPWYGKSIPGAIGLLGLLLMIWKVRGIRRAHEDAGISLRYKFLKNTGFFQRASLSVGAIALGAGAHFAGSVAASVPALATAAVLWMLDRPLGVLKPRAGGSWRQMTEEDTSALLRVLAVYRRRRRSALDIATPWGMALFAATVVTGGYGIWKLHSFWPEVAFGAAVTAVIWILPIWFSFTRSELPVDPTVESFEMLRRWKRGLARLVGRMSPNAEAVYWIREDDHGPIEVRMRVFPLPENLTGLEIATEVVRANTEYNVRKVAILRLVPGTQAARRIAACPNAVEHHLSADLNEEIIVLRNRRGKRDAGFAPLKNALALLQG